MNIKRRIIALILAITTLFLCSVPVYAAGSEEFLSEVSLIYKDSVEEAKKAIEGTDWKLYEKDLNANADIMFDDGVYLIYKTSTNVEDAITDLRVMDMYGGFEESNYQQQLEEGRESYEAVVAKLKIVADEFSALYNSGNKMAIVAHRQLNYYKDIGESNLLLGDFLLNVPSDEAFLQLIMEGSSLVISNLLSLLAVGVSGSHEDSFATRVTSNYANPNSIDKSGLEELAQTITTYLTETYPAVLYYDAVKEDFDTDDENMSEEEFQFIIQTESLVKTLEAIKIGNQTLCDLVRKNTFTINDIYPIAAALSDGQAALVDLGLIETVLKYGVPAAITPDFYATLDELEADLKDENGNIEPIDVYIGVDRSVFEGSFAMTDEAARLEALTGESWNVFSTFESMSKFHKAAICLLGIDAGFSLLYFGSFKISKLVAVWASKNMDAFLSSKVLPHITNFGYKYLAPGLKVAKWAAIGIALVALGVLGIGTIYGYYNPNYTQIPNMMVDVREGELGDNYIKYTAAKVFGEEDKNADFNAYQGKEWIALYYTKDAAAGNCLTPNFKYSETDSSVARRHQGISMFGESKAFDLNSHVYDGDAKPVYLSLRYSTTKKAAADLPDVIGSMFVNGALYVVTALVGAGVGAGSICLVNYYKSKKKTAPETEPVEEINTQG